MQTPEKILKTSQNWCCQVTTALDSIYTLFTLIWKGLLTVFSISAQLVTPSPSENHSSFSCSNPSVETWLQWQLKLKKKKKNNLGHWSRNAPLWFWYVWYGHYVQDRTVAGRVTWHKPEWLTRRWQSKEFPAAEWLCAFSCLSINLGLK